MRGCHTAAFVLSGLCPGERVELILSFPCSNNEMHFAIDLLKSNHLQAVVAKVSGSGDRHGYSDEIVLDLL